MCKLTSVDTGTFGHMKVKFQDLAISIENVERVDPGVLEDLDDLVLVWKQV